MCALRDALLGLYTKDSEEDGNAAVEHIVLERMAQTRRTELKDVCGDRDRCSMQVNRSFIAELAFRINLRSSLTAWVAMLSTAKWSYLNFWKSTA
jgi:hypothetical protein